jgi:hypothetical protein
MRRYLVALLLIGTLASAGSPSLHRSLSDYRYFRALCIDLLGRPPTPGELLELEAPGFDFAAWIDAHLSAPGYADRLEQIYMDLLRLDLAPTFRFEPSSISLHRVRLAGPSGAVDVYFRSGQRRSRAETDGQICFTQDESGVRVQPNGASSGTPKPLSQALIDERTVQVKPWWLYADYRSRAPNDRLAPDWATRFPGYALNVDAFVDPDGKPTTTVRVCREEASTSDEGHIVATGRVVRKKDPLPPGRTTRPPVDTDFAKANPGRVVSCGTTTAYASSPECGCGVGLERCMPETPAGFIEPIEAPLGAAESFFSAPRPASLWMQAWWGEEAKHFMARIFSEDRDARELLTSRATVINGPLAQFYRSIASITCCGSSSTLGYADPTPLFVPAQVPSNLVPEQVATWADVEDRGPHAAGLMTMPVFLVKYGTRRARAHVLYNAFLCKDFVADNVTLEPSQEPDLMKRPGCSLCHRTLEPMAAYFARVQESDWTYLPSEQFPISLERCAAGDPKTMSPACRTYYDPAFTTADHTVLRGANGSPANADAGPAGLAQEITRSPLFSRCVVQNVTQSFLGRSLGPDDELWRASLDAAFVAGGYRMKALVRAILLSPQYRDANDEMPGVGP